MLKRKKAKSDSSAERTPKVAGCPVLGNLYQLESCERKATHLLSGELVHLTLNDTVSDDSFVRQPDRVMARGEAVRVWVHEDAIEWQRAGYKAHLSIDTWLRWGRNNSKRHPIALVTGTPVTDGTEKTMVQVLVFREGKLVSISEKFLPFLESTRFMQSMVGLLGEVKSNNRAIDEIYIADPLPQVESAKHLGSLLQEVRTIVRRPLVDPTKKRLMPMLSLAAILAVGATGWLMGTVLPWIKLSTLQAGYTVLNNQLGAAEVSQARLDLLQQRRFFMQEVPPQVKRTQKLMDVLQHSAAMPAVLMRQVRLDDKGEMEMTFALVKEATPATLQGKPIVAEMASRSGVALHLSSKGWRELEINGRGMRQYVIEGNIDDSKSK
ncbi:hypothetical protein [Marinobacterium stanieri]|uniref:Uncharacterized protein n=1 Tax=Marinobacterium stanieri TaxID=49186 RepID=A0A1N6XGS4_9GAMM|nr:hypothetical protein [Marinobacterium stanieri]SIR01562.1 hypothetical protein SAMN05421647_11421 [Marinobacterium stanieri]